MTGRDGEREERRVKDAFRWAPRHRPVVHADLAPGRARTGGGRTEAMRTTAFLGGLSGRRINGGSPALLDTMRALM